MHEYLFSRVWYQIKSVFRSPFAKLFFPRLGPSAPLSITPLCNVFPRPLYEPYLLQTRSNRLFGVPNASYRCSSFHFFFQILLIQAFPMGDLRRIFSSSPWMPDRPWVPRGKDLPPRCPRGCPRRSFDGPFTQYLRIFIGPQTVPGSPTRLQVNSIENSVLWSVRETTRSTNRRDGVARGSRIAWKETRQDVLLQKQVS